MNSVVWYERETVTGGTRRWSYDRNGNVARFVEATVALHTFDYDSWNSSGSDHRSSWRSDTNSPTRPKKRCRPWSIQEERRANIANDLKDRLIEVRRQRCGQERYKYDGRTGSSRRPTVSGWRSRQSTRVLRSSNPSAASHPERSSRSSNDKQGRYVAATTSVGAVEFAYDDFGNRILDQRDGTVWLSMPSTGSDDLPAALSSPRFTTEYRRRNMASLWLLTRWTEPNDHTSRSRPRAAAALQWNSRCQPVLGRRSVSGSGVVERTASHAAANGPPTSNSADGDLTRADYSDIGSFSLATTPRAAWLAWSLLEMPQRALNTTGPATSSSSRMPIK
jgi:hypothetical protein